MSRKYSFILRESLCRHLYIFSHILKQTEPMFVLGEPSEDSIARSWIGHFGGRVSLWLIFPLPQICQKGDNFPLNKQKWWSGKVRIKSGQDRTSYTPWSYWDGVGKEGVWGEGGGVSSRGFGGCEETRTGVMYIGLS